MAKAFKKAAEMFSNMANTAESAFSTPEKEATAAEVAAEIAAEVASILKAVKKVMPRADNLTYAMLRSIKPVVMNQSDIKLV